MYVKNKKLDFYFSSKVGGTKNMQKKHNFQRGPTQNIKPQFKHAYSTLSH